MEKRVENFQETSDNLRLKRIFIALFDYKAKKICYKMLHQNYLEKLD